MRRFRLKAGARHVLPVGLAVGLGLAGCSRPDRVSRVEADVTLERIRPEQVSTHIGSLAEMVGRGKEASGSSCPPVVEYVEGQFQALGLQAVGVDGYAQAVPLRRAELVDGRCMLPSPRGKRLVMLRPDEDFVMLPNAAREIAGVASRAVFAGFGITAPQLGYDDYREISPRGRLVVVLSGAPRSFPPDLQAHYGAPEVVLENAAAHGAAGLLVVDTPQADGVPWEEVVRAASRGRTHWMDAKKAPYGPWSQIASVALLSVSGADSLFKGVGTSLDEVMATAEAGKVRTFDMPFTVNLRTSSRHIGAGGTNVVAMLPGSDPALRDEYVVYASGLACGEAGDVSEGDEGRKRVRANVSPTAVLLEVARAFTALPERPRRSILFMVGAMEGPGRLGPDYFAHNPTVPAERIVKNITAGSGAGADSPPAEALHQNADGHRDPIWQWCSDAGPALGPGFGRSADPIAWAELAQREFAAVRQAASAPPQPK